MIPAIFGCSSEEALATVAAGLPCWRTSGKLYFEVEVLEKRGEAAVIVGLAGSNFHAKLIGVDDTAWGIMQDGTLLFRLVPFLHQHCDNFLFSFPVKNFRARSMPAAGSKRAWCFAWTQT